MISRTNRRHLCHGESNCEASRCAAMVVDIIMQCLSSSNVIRSGVSSVDRSAHGIMYETVAVERCVGRKDVVVCGRGHSD
jgi:hypothetical protein